VAIKLPLRRGDTYPLLERERISLEQLVGVAGPEVLGVERVSKRFALVLEWVEGEPLSDHLRQKRAFTQTEFYHINRGLARQLSGIHEFGFAYLNLKPENVLVGEQPRLIDFGKTRHRREPNPGGVEGGDVRAVDIHAFASLVCCMLQPDWKIGQDVPLHFPDGERVPGTLILLLARALDTPDKRPTSQKFVSTLRNLVEQRLLARMSPEQAQSEKVHSTDDWARDATKEVEGLTERADISREMLPRVLEENQRDLLRATFDNPTMRERLLSHMKLNEEN
jgi:serine/threonine protein kinase